MPDQESQAVQDLFGSTKYINTSGKVSRKPQPWHRLRKQVVRESQWCEAIELILPRLVRTNSNLKYIGLPGSDLLDIRIIHDMICVPNSLSMYFFGFNSEARVGHKNQLEADISLDEVRRLANIDPNSLVKPDDLASLSNDAHVAIEQAQSQAPFNIVNIDLCNGVAKEAPGGQGVSMYNAIAKVIHLQYAAKEPWVFFLTTRVGEQYNSSDAIDLLLNAYTENLKQCQPFRKSIEEHFGSLYSNLDENSLKDPEKHFNIFITSVSKWLINLGIQSKPPWKVELLKSYSYQVASGNSHNDIASLSYKFTPLVQAPRDKYNLADLNLGIEITECKLAPAIVSIVKGTLDCDKELLGNDSLRETMAENCATLMEKARYNKQEFKRWALNDALRFHQKEIEA